MSKDFFWYKYSHLNQQMLGNSPSFRGIIVDHQQLLEFSSPTMNSLQLEALSVITKCWPAKGQTKVWKSCVAFQNQRTPLQCSLNLERWQKKYNEKINWDLLEKNHRTGFIKHSDLYFVHLNLNAFNTNTQSHIYAQVGSLHGTTWEDFAWQKNLHHRQAMAGKTISSCHSKTLRSSQV